MSPDSASAWQGATKIKIGKALLDEDEGLTASQLESAIGGPHQSNLKKAAEQLVEAQALKAVPPRTNGQPGRPAQVAFAFAEGERERFEDLLEARDPSEELGVGTHLVFVDSKGNSKDLWKALSQAGVMKGSGRARQLVGDQQEIMVSFSGPTAADDSLDFLEILGDLELKARLQAVTKESSIGELRRAARRRGERVARMRAQLGPLQTAPRPEP